MGRARSLSALGSALLLSVVVALVGPLAGPATAAVCGPGDGVSVVVDARGVGGSLSSACDAGGAGDVGSDIVPRAGYPLEYVQRQPGFVCQVSGLPSSDSGPCQRTPPADAYWGLFWSDGKSGTWSYASVGIRGLRIPAGGSIGLAWQDGSGRKVPGIAPPVASSAPASTPTPTPTPSSAPAPTSGRGSSGGGTGGSDGPRTTARSAGPASETGTSDAEAAEGRAARSQRRERRKARAEAGAEASASATPSAGVAETEEPEVSAAAESDAVSTASPDGGLPLAVPLVLLGLLAALAAGAAVRRRRGTGTA